MELAVVSGLQLYLYGTWSISRLNSLSLASPVGLEQNSDTTVNMLSNCVSDYGYLIYAYVGYGLRAYIQQIISVRENKMLELCTINLAVLRVRAQHLQDRWRNGYSGEGRF